MDRSRDLIQGKVFKSILYFSMPLLIGNLFQQLYNTVDSYVVGNYVSSTALAAVGQSTPIINVIVGFFMGLATGAGVVVSQFYGAHDERRLSLSVHTSMALTLLLCIVFTFIGLVSCVPILRFIKSPAAIMPMATTYLKIYFWGISFMLIYNIGAGIQRAVGDSKRPLYDLIASSLVNVVLDLYFVCVLHLGVAGAAYATLIAQGVSALLVMIQLCTTPASYRLDVRKLRIESPILSRVIRIGIPAALQQSVISFSNVYVMSYINHFGTAAVAGYTTYTKIDGFIILPVQSLAMAITTFTGQNYGARKYDRIYKGMYLTIAFNEIISLIFVGMILLFGKDLLRLFTHDQQVIQDGYIMAKVFLIGYLIIPFTNIMSGVLRGVGKSFVPMSILIFCYVFLRQIYLAIVTHFDHALNVVFAGWPITWGICAIILLVYYHKVFHLPLDDEKDFTSLK